MMHTEKIIGKLNSDLHFKSKYQAMLGNNQVERIDITRLESERSRLRKVSDRGTDLALTLIPGSHIRVPENVAIVSFNSNIPSDKLFGIAIKLGQIIGAPFSGIRTAQLIY